MAFSAFSLVFLWLMQTLFFGGIYGFYKKQVLKNESAIIAQNIEPGNKQPYYKHKSG